MSIFHWKTFCWIFLLQTTFAPGRGRGFSNNNPSFPSSSSTLVSITIPTEEKVLENGRRRLSNLKAGGVWSYIFITSGNCDDVQGRESVDSRGKCLAYVESIHSKGDGTRDEISACSSFNSGDCLGSTYTRTDYPIGCFQGEEKWAFNKGETVNGVSQTNEDCADSHYGTSTYSRPVENVLGCVCRFQQAEINISPFEALDGVGGCETVQELRSGRCTNFLTAAECKALGDSSITISSGSYDSEFTDETYPSGCYVQSNKYYYQQNLTNKCKHLLEVEDTTTQPYTCDFTKAQSYTIVTSGLSNARYNILTEEECETYVAIGGFFFDTIVIGISFVPGCREEISSGNIYYNSNLEKNFVVDYVANVFETVYMHCKLFLTHSYQNDLPSKFNYGHWIGNFVLELDRVGLLLALLFLFLGALCIFSWPSGRINNDAERFRRGTLFRWKMNRASMFSLVGFASVHSVGAFEVVEITANKCAASELLSEVECKAHADGSMSAGTWGGNLATETFPFGCYKGDNNLFFYNPLSSSTLSCSSAIPCQCAPAVSIIEKTSGTCTEHLTEAQCLSQTLSYTMTETSPNVPRGCFLQFYQGVWAYTWNSRKDSTSTCDSAKKCQCKVPIAVKETTSGKCTHFLTESECKAHSDMGTEYTQGTIYSTPQNNKPSGCYVEGAMKIISFNPGENSARNCDTSLNCLCKIDVEPKSEGTCSKLLTEAECTNLATSVIPQPSEVMSTVTNPSMFPSGCYIDVLGSNNNNKYVYNKRTGSSKSCSHDNHVCMCKTISTSTSTTCTCPNGTPTVAAGSGGTLCATNGDVDCSACDAGYTISDYVLAAVIDGTKKTWDHDNPIWTDDTVYDANGEKKTSAFNTLKSNAIRVS